MKLLGIIADHTTPKITTTGISFTIAGTDNHRGGCITVVLSKDNKKPNGEKNKWIIA